MQISRQPNPFTTALPVEIQDQTSEAIDLYLCKNSGTTTLANPTTIGAKSVVVTSATGAAIGDCIDIKQNGHTFQSIITNVVSTTISIASPCDTAFTAGAIVEFGEWNLATADGSVTPAIFMIQPPAGVKLDIYELSVSMEDNAVMYESTFGGITALTGGLVGRIVDGATKNLFLTSNNAGFREYGFDTAYPDKFPAGTYAFWGNKNYKESNGVAIRSNGDTQDRIEIIVQDNLTGLTKLAMTIHGHLVVD